MLVTEGDVLDALERDVKPAGSVMLRHVRSMRSDGGPERTIDAVMCGTSPGRGIVMSAFEVKCSRQDLRAELANVDKAEWWASMVDAFWLVVSNADMLRRLDLPPAWGVLAPVGHGGRLAMVQQPMQPERIPTTVPRALLAAVLQAAARERPVTDRSDLMKLAEQAAGWDRERAERDLRTAQDLAEAWRYRVAQLLGIPEHDAVRLVLENADEAWTSEMAKRITNAGSAVGAERVRAQVVAQLRETASWLEQGAGA